MAFLRGLFDKVNQNATTRRTAGRRSIALELSSRPSAAPSTVALMVRARRRSRRRASRTTRATAQDEERRASRDPRIPASIQGYMVPGACELRSLAGMTAPCSARFLPASQSCSGGLLRSKFLYFSCINRAAPRARAVFFLTGTWANLYLKPSFDGGAE